MQNRAIMNQLLIFKQQVTSVFILKSSNKIIHIFLCLRFNIKYLLNSLFKNNFLSALIILRLKETSKTKEK